MGNNLRFDYYYGAEAEQFSFYRVPRLLIKDERFKGLSSDAKLLYGLMLDRMALSMKNGWFNEENRAYIHYTVENIMEDLGCAKATCVKVIAELDSKKGIGLIEKKRQGLGRPDIIYVKNFVAIEQTEQAKIEEEKPANTDVSTEVQELNGNYNNNNYTDMSYTNPINLSVQGQNMRVAQADDTMDGMEEVSAYIELIKQNIEYEHLMAHGEWRDKSLYKELFEVICEVVCVKRKTVRVGGEDYPYELVKSKFLKLDSTHLQYVIGCMQNTTTKIANIKAYMITSLYNASNTINHYYQQEVQHDMYGGGWHEKGIV